MESGALGNLIRKPVEDELYYLASEDRVEYEGATAGGALMEVIPMADDWYETVYENKHDVVSEFVRKKQSTGCSHRTFNSYSRTLKKFFHERFPDLRRPR